MALQNRQWITVDECVNNYLDESDQSIHKYAKCFHIAFRGMNELGLDAFYAVKSIRIPVESNMTAKLPHDYISYSKVGVLNAYGEIITMGMNSKLTVAFDTNPTRVAQTTDNTSVTTTWGVQWLNYWNGQYYGAIYGLPSGTPFIGSFKIDNANGVIVLSQNFTYPYVMLEYVASPALGEDYYIPLQFMEAVISYIRWKDAISIPSKTHAANSNVQMRRHDYFEARRLAIARYDPVNFPDLHEWSLQTQRITVKA